MRVFPGARCSRLMFTLLIAGIALLAVPGAVSANRSQNGADMVIINPGGGLQADGSDGIAAVFNGENASSPNFQGGSRFAPSAGSDQQFFAGTYQWCCGGVGPILYAGTPTAAGTPNSPGSWPAPAEIFVGEAGAAANNNAASWGATGGVSIIATSGAVVRVPAGTAATGFPANAPTGSGSATIRYTATVGGLTYIIDRAISYTYPNNFYTETYTFTVPTGNADPVQFYLGGDAAPGSSDSGRGAMTTTPNRVLYEINTSSQIFVAYGEVGSPAVSPFSSGWVAAYSAPYGAIQRGYSLTANCPSPATVVDTDFCIDSAAGNHDAGLNIQWTLPATPGTYTRVMRTIVSFQGQSIGARFASATVNSGQDATLEIEVVNTGFASVSGVGFDLTIPSGLSISGAATSTCGGTLSAAASATTVSLTGGTIAGGSNCLISVPVAGADGTYTVADQDFGNLAPGTLTKGFGTSSVQIGTPVSEYALQVTRAGAGAGTVVSSPAGIDCGSTCSASFGAGTSVTLTATAASGSTFSGWSGSSCTGTGNCTVTMSEARNVTATFALQPAPTVELNLPGSGETQTANRFDIVVRLPTATSQGPTLRAGCSAVGVSLVRCEIVLYADRSQLRTQSGLVVDPRTRQSGRVVIGKGVSTSTGTEVLNTTVTLNRLGQRMLRNRVGGVDAEALIRAQVGDGAVIENTKSGRLYLPRQVVAPTDGLFAVDSAKMTRQGRRYVRTLKRSLPAKAKRLTCVGYTDSTGAANYNLKLGLNRARAVCRALRRAGVKATAIRATSRGEAAPRATNETAAGRALNRRVQISIRY